jgi:hypothetical protein
MPDEYLTIAEVGARLKLAPKTVKNKMASGIFQRGVHYFSPPGISARFKWSAVIAWLEEADQGGCNPRSTTNSPGYDLGKPKGLDIGGDLT